MSERPKENSILYQLMNYERNRGLLTLIPHIRYLDMAIVFYCWKDEDDHTAGAYLVTNDLAQDWGCTTEELERIAAYNTPRKQPVTFQPMDEMLRELLGEGELLTEYRLEPAIPMHILTNKNKTFGAAAILYPQVLWAVSQSLGEDVYVLPSSIHEVIIVPVSVNCSQRELEEIVTDINRTQVPRREILSDHVFLYRRKEDFLGL